MSKTSKILRIVGRVFEALYIVAMLSFSCVAILLFRADMMLFYLPFRAFSVLINLLFRDL